MLGRKVLKSQIKISDINSNSIVGLPLTIEIENGPTVSLAEADLTDYAGMYLVDKPGDTPTLVSKLSPLPGSDGVCVKANSPHKSPWRVIMIGGEPGDFLTP